MTKPPIQTALEAMADFNCQMMYGSPSVKTWQRACGDSLARSQRRRRIDDERKDGLPWRIGVSILVLIWMIFFGFLLADIIRSI